MWVQGVLLVALCVLGPALGQDEAAVVEPADKPTEKPAKKATEKNSEKTSQYDKQAISVSFEGEGLPAFGFLNGTVQELDELPSTIMLNKTKATLNCSSGYMGISLQFQQPFYGIVYADYDRNSACKMTGNGNVVGEIKLPLKGCGTLQKPVRVFTNNIVVRFHPGLEIDGDEVITIVCRYPPPKVIPPIIPAGLQLPVGEEVRALQPLREFEILLIICAIVFLALLLLGIGCSYYCLKKRNIKVVRRRPASTLGSEVTKISEPISMFGGLKIPRAHAEDTSGSEELTESVRSEFASDIASTASEDDYTSAYSDAPFELMEGTVYPELHVPPRPGFDVRTKVKREERAFSPVDSKASSESELILKAQEQYLTTILERTEVNTLETLERVRKAEAIMGPPPVHARVRVVNKSHVSDTSELESESEYSQAATDISDYYHDKLQLHTSEQANLTLTADKYSSSQQHQDQQQQNLQHQQQLYQQHLYQQQMKQHQHQQQPPHGKMQQQLQKHQQKMLHDELVERHLVTTNVEERHHVTSSTTKNILNMETQDLITPVIVERATLNLNVGDKRKRHQEPARNNFDVLIRILDAPISYIGGGAATDDDDVSSVLTEEERFRLREVITHDVEIKQFLQESHTTEKMLMLKDYRQLGKIIEPQKWDVLIRIIDNADAMSMTRGSGSQQSTVMQRISASSEAAQELRSMSEMSVDFANYGEVQETRSAFSGMSSTYTQARSVADRSGTEIVETGHFINREAYFRSEAYEE